MPLYARTFKLAGSANGFHAPANAGGNPGPHTGMSGLLGYHEV